MEPLPFQDKSKIMKKFTFVLIIAVLMIMIGCSKYPDLGDGYKFDSDGKYSLQIVNFENTVMVSTHILEYAFDSTFIIVSQRPWDSIPNIRTMNFKESNKAFEKSMFLQYWIVNKKEKCEYSLDTLSKVARYSNVYGPFKEDEYLIKRKKLGVPDKLKLKSK
jgi:hypothetical protein